MRIVKLTAEWLLLVVLILIVPIQIVNLIGLGDRGVLPWWFVCLHVAMLPPWLAVVSRSQWKRIKQTTSVAVLMLAFAASGSVPPMPIPRPAPLKSPRDASQPKSTPMVRESVPLTEPAPVMWIEIQSGLNLTGCDTNDPNCRLWFIQHVSKAHPAGYDLSIRFRDTVNGDGPELAWFGAGPVDRISELNWPQQEPKPNERYFTSILTLPILPASATAMPAIRVNPAFSGVSAWSRKK